MIKINERLVKYNYSSRGGEKIKYIVIHDTGNTGKKADADAHFNYLNTGNRGASAHYFVDDKQILRVIRDEDKSWSCGDGKGKYGITNENSIGIEMCINYDGDFKKTYKNTIRLTKHLMKKYNIPLERVVRHYDASRKLCPNIFKDNNWKKWEEFKAMAEIKNYEKEIREIYKKLLKREPDPEGLKYWVNEVYDSETFGVFVLNVLESGEYKNG